MNRKVTYSDIFRYAWYIWKPRRKIIPVLMAGMALAAVIDTLFPLVVGRLIDVITSESPDMNDILVTFALFLGIDTVYHLVRNGTILTFNPTAVKNLQAVTREGFGKVQRFSANWHANAFAGGTVRKITRGMWSFDVFEDNIFMYLYPTAIVLISTTVILAWHWPVMGLVTVASAAVYIGYSVWSILTINAPRFRASAEADTKMGAAMADSITANATVKSFGREGEEDAMFADVTEYWREKALNSWQVATLNDLVRRFISVLMMGALMWTAVWLWQQGRATPGDVVYVFTAYLVLSAYLRHIGEQVSNLQKAMSEMEDVVFFWKTDIAVKDAPDATAFKPGVGEIVFDRVRFAYHGQVNPIYDDFSLTIAPGEKVALVGPSGAGKSTFVKLVQRLYDLDGGQIRIDGQDIARVTQSSLRRGISLVPQDPVLFHRTLAENIAYGRPEASMDDIIDAARKAFAHDFIATLPQKYDTLVGERGIKLSGGERQRVAIARAILADAKILILDEATSSLDSISEHYIQRALETLIEGKTTITIAHRLATIKSVDRILVFDNGSVVEQGTHESLIRTPGSHYKRLYDMQALDLVGERHDRAGD